MARIKDTSVDAVKAAANIVDLVEARTRLRKVGARYTGLCPFHQEKTPSFSVSPDRGTYYCFGCQAGGDAISFVRETESLDFVGAIEWLADRFNVPLEYDESSPQAEAQRQAQGAAVRAARPGGVVLRAGAVGGVGQGGAGVPRVARPGRGGVPRVPARALARGGDAREEGAREGVHGRGARRRGPRHAARLGLLPAAVDVSAHRRARPRSSASRRASSTRTTRCAASTSTLRRASSSTSRTSCTGSTWRAGGDEGGPGRSSSRGTRT